MSYFGVMPWRWSRSRRKCDRPNVLIPSLAFYIVYDDFVVNNLYRKNKWPGNIFTSDLDLNFIFVALLFAYKLCCFQILCLIKINRYHYFNYDMTNYNIIKYYLFHISYLRGYLYSVPYYDICTLYNDDYVYNHISIFICLW